MRQVTCKHLYLGYSWVIPNQFSKSLQVTLSELDKTRFLSTTCGFMKPDKILLSYVVWLPDYSPSKVLLFPNFCWYSNYSNPHNILILHCFVISIIPLKHEEWAFIWYLVWLHLTKFRRDAHSLTLTFNLTRKVPL